MYTDTGAFSTQSLGTLFKNAIARGKSKLHQQTDSKKLSKISRRIKNMWQKLQRIPSRTKKLFIFKIITIKSILLVDKIWDEKCSYHQQPLSIFFYSVTFVHNI